MDEEEAQEVLDRIEDDMDIPSDIVHDMDPQQFEEFIETWADLKEAEFDTRPRVTDKFLDKLEQFK